MSTMTETLHKEEALFIPSEATTNGTATDTPKHTPKVAGEYLGHITDTRTTVVDWTDKKTGNLLKARIYNFKVHVAPENSSLTYKYTDRNGHEHTTTGEVYVGWKVIADGVFRFLEPVDGDTFVSNSSGNDRFLRFCQALGVTIETVEREVGGKTVEVQLLPTLEPEDINGLPVTAVVNRHKDDWINDEGRAMPQWRCKFIKTWRDGKRLAATTTNDIPF